MRADVETLIGPPLAETPETIEQDRLSEDEDYHSRLGMRVMLALLILPFLLLMVQLRTGYDLPVLNVLSLIGYNMPAVLLGWMLVRRGAIPHNGRRLRGMEAVRVLMLILGWNLFLLFWPSLFHWTVDLFRSLGW